VAPDEAGHVRLTWPVAEEAVTVGTAGGVQGLTAVTEAGAEFSDSQLAMVLMEDAT
jgi:hypothetical protein